MIIELLKDIIKDASNRKQCEDHNRRCQNNVWSSRYDVSGDNATGKVCIIPNCSDDCDRIASLLIPDICAEFTVTAIFIDCNTHDIDMVSYIDEDSEELIEESVSGLNMIPDDKKEEYHKLCKAIVESATIYPL